MDFKKKLNSTEQSELLCIRVRTKSEQGLNPRELKN